MTVIMPTLEYKQTALMLQIEVMEGTLCYTKKEGGQWCSMPTAFVVLKHIMIQPFQKQHYITAMESNHAASSKEIFEVNQWKALRNRRLFLIKLIEKRDNLETKCNQLQISVVADKFENFIENKRPMDRYRLPFPIKFFLYYFR